MSTCLLTMLLAAAVSLQGRLEVRENEAPVLHSGGKAIVLAAAETFTAGTLRDQRLSGRTLKLLGSFRPDGSFQVDEFFTVRPDGSLHRLIYFCDT